MTGQNQTSRNRTGTLSSNKQKEPPTYLAVVHGTNKSNSRGRTANLSDSRGRTANLSDMKDRTTYFSLVGLNNLTAETGARANNLTNSMRQAVVGTDRQSLHLPSFI
jgi:hypothetical protein